MRYKLPPLPFEPGAISPGLSHETLEFHHGKFHRGQIARLNELIEGSPFAELSLEDLIQVTGHPKLVHEQSREIFVHAVQSWNHTLYWHSMSGKKGRPAGALLHRIKQDFGGIEGLKDCFLSFGSRHVGTGWLWLVAGARSRLEILVTSDTSNPIVEGKIPLLVCDLWEHAYHLDFRDAKSRYLEAFWQMIDWEFVQETFSAARIPEMGRRMGCLRASAIAMPAPRNCAVG